MNKHEGTDFLEYLEKKGKAEKIEALAKEQWKVYLAEAMEETGLTAEELRARGEEMWQEHLAELEAEEKAENAKKAVQSNGIFSGLRHRIRHLFSS